MKSDKLSELIGTVASKVISGVGSQAFYYVILSLFILQGLLYIFTVSHSTPPDEMNHFAIIMLFADNNYLPFFSEQTNNFYLGDLTRNPSLLYHYLLLFPYQIIQVLPRGAEIIVLRLLNLGIATSSVLVLKKLFSLKLDNFFTNLLLILVTNTMMFSFLSAAINYDNLLILISAASFYVLVLMHNGKPSPRLLVSWLVLVISGSLVKEAFLPILIGQALIVALLYRSRLKETFVELREAIVKKEVLVIAQLIFALVLGGLFIEKYGVNLVQYQNPTPYCEDVHDHETCMQWGIYSRKVRLTQTKDPDFVPTTREFIPGWVAYMADRIVGVHARPLTLPWSVALHMYWALWVIFLIAVIRKYKAKDYWVNSIIFISAIYILALLLTNYGSYQRYGVFLAVQGRYLFPVFPVLMFVGMYYFKKQKNAATVAAISSLVIIPIVYISNIPTYFYKSDPIVFTEQGRELARRLKLAIDPN